MSRPGILVIEDEAIVARDLVRQVNELGYEVVGDTPSGEEAIEWVERLRPDLVLMDIQLAGKTDGIAAACQIRERFGTPVVFLTAFASPSIMHRAKMASPFGYLVKPFDPVQLGAAIEMALHQQEVELHLRQSREELATILRTAMDAFWVCDCAGRLVDVNEAACGLLGYTRAELLQLRVSDIELVDSPEETRRHIAKVQSDGADRFETRHRTADGRMIEIEASVKYLPVGEGKLVCFFRDITERKRAEQEREVTVRLLGLINGQHDLPNLLREVIDLLREWTDCEAVGIRLRDGDDYPYFEARGFSEAFLAAEGTLCRRDATGAIVRGPGGEPVLECMCGRILCGHGGPAKPFFTPHGSFWRNGLADWPAGTSAEDRAAFTRNRCNSEGFESVALVPMRVGATVYGLLQFNDRRRGRFSAERIALLERLADNLAVAVAQRQAGAALKDNERRIRLLLESTTDYRYSVEHRPDGSLQTQHGPGCLKVTGYAPEEFAQRPQLWLEMVPPEDRTMVATYAAHIGTGEQPPPLEHRIVHRDGSIRWVRSSVVVHRAASGVELVHEGVVTDITDRKRVELALESSRTELAAIYDYTPIITLLLDKSLHIVRANRAAERFAGRKESALVGLAGGDLLGCVNVEDDPRGCGFGEECAHCALRKAVQETLATGQSQLGVESQPYVVRGRRAQDFFVTVSTARLQVGEDLRVLLCIEDVSARRRAERALRSSEAKFAQVFRASPLMIALSVLETGTYLEVNEAFLRLTGYSAEEVIGHSSTALGLMDPAVRPRIVAELQTKGRLVALPLTVVGKGGRRLDCLFSGEIVEIDGAMRLLSIALDTTELKRMETQFRQAQKMEAVGQLAGGVAHDFNNILVAILLHLGLLREEKSLDAETLGILQELEREATRAAGLTRQLLAFSRRQVMQVKPVHPDELLINLLKMLRRLIGENIEVILANAAGLPVVEADPGMIEQVVVNLCVNARDAMPRGGRLTLGTAAVALTADQAQARAEARAGLYVCLSVADTGCGMDEGLRSHLFEPFFTTKEPGKGTGLGLATVYGIVKQHNGWVEVDSKVGQGSTFRIYLPAGAVAPGASGEAEAGELPRGRNETVLVVEDEPSVRQVMASTLRRFGYRVLEAGSGPEAIARWSEHHDEIDLLLTDIVMPGTPEGVELADRLRGQRPSLRVVFCSGYSQTQSVPSGPNTAALPKPFETVTLLSTVRQCLDGAPPPPPTP